MTRETAEWIFWLSFIPMLPFVAYQVYLLVSAMIGEFAYRAQHRWWMKKEAERKRKAAGL